MEGEEIVGSYKLKPNQPYLGNHVVNGGYIISEKHRGKQLGITLGQHSLEEARKMGYQAIQFNAAVSTNIKAVNLWEKLGFRIVGTNPKAFRHKTEGYVDTYTMYRELYMLNLR